MLSTKGLSQVPFFWGIFNLMPTGRCGQVSQLFFVAKTILVQGVSDLIMCVSILQKNWTR